MLRTWGLGNFGFAGFWVERRKSKIFFALPLDKRLKSGILYFKYILKEGTLRRS